jgi:hypothetical protein
MQRVHMGGGGKELCIVSVSSWESTFASMSEGITMGYVDKNVSYNLFFTTVGQVFI